MVSKARRFDGENTWFYFLWYGLGRFWIEGCGRTACISLTGRSWGSPSACLRALSLLLAVTAAVMLFYNIKIKSPSRDELLVNQVAAGKPPRGRQRRIFPRRKRESTPAGQEDGAPQPPETQKRGRGEN